MSKTQKTYMGNQSSIPYWKTAIVIAPLLLLLVASLLFNFLYPKTTGVTELLSSFRNADKEFTVENGSKFVDLGTFAVHLKGDSEYLRTSISVKLTKPGLDGKIKNLMPEITHHVNMVLQNKQSSELSTYEGKERLAQQIKKQVEYVMGFIQKDSASSNPVDGISDVLFTSFVIQY